MNIVHGTQETKTNNDDIPAGKKQKSNIQYKQYKHQNTKIFFKISKNTRRILK